MWQARGGDQPPSTWDGPQPFLRGLRVSLRPWDETDIDQLVAACQDREISRWTTVPWPYGVEHARGFVRDLAPTGWRERRSAEFAVVDADRPDRLLGACGLVTVDLAAGWGEIGYWVAPWARGMGVATAAARLLADWSFAEGGLSELLILVLQGNAASSAVARRVGAVPDGTTTRERCGGHHVLDRFVVRR